MDALARLGTLWNSRALDDKHREFVAVYETCTGGQAAGLRGRSVGCLVVLVRIFDGMNSGIHGRRNRGVAGVMGPTHLNCDLGPLTTDTTESLMWKFFSLTLRNQ